MKMPVGRAVLLGAAVHLTAGAQAPGAPEDFYGVYVAQIYVAVPDVTMPAVVPFTAQGERTFNDYDVFSADPNQTDDCVAEQMPDILWTGDPMRIIEQDGRLVFHYERRDTVRTIHMDGAPPPADQPHTELGYSVGRWMGEELWIETTHVLDGVLHSRGYPFSREGRLTERYWREPGGNVMQMELLVEDPVNYTDSLTFGRGWVFSPGAEVRPWECVSLGARDAAPDIDELVRMLDAL